MGKTLFILQNSSSTSQLAELTQCTTTELSSEHIENMKAGLLLLAVAHLFNQFICYVQYLGLYVLLFVSSGGCHWPQ